MTRFKFVQDHSSMHTRSNNKIYFELVSGDTLILVCLMVMILSQLFKVASGETPRSLSMRTRGRVTTKFIEVRARVHVGVNID